jgi:uncharacterized protein
LSGRRLRLLPPLVALFAIPGCDSRHNDFRYAMSLIHAGDVTSGAKVLMTLAKTGHAPSQLRLGLLYQSGQGAAREPSKAAYWFAQAASQGDVGAQYKLAEAYLRGDGVPVSPEKGFQGFLRLAELGFAPAQYQIAQAYAKGQGVARDDRLSVVWLERAAHGGHHEAAQRLALAYSQGSLGLAKDPRQAEAWQQKTQPPRF